MQLLKTDWQQKGSLQVGAPNTEAAARWIFNNMTKKNKKLLGSILRNWFEVSNAGWLDDGTAEMWSMVIEDRGRALNKAIMAGKLGKDMCTVPTHRNYWRHAIGATICELIAQCELDPEWIYEG